VADDSESGPWVDSAARVSVSMAVLGKENALNSTIRARAQRDVCQTCVKKFAPWEAGNPGMAATLEEEVGTWAVDRYAVGLQEASQRDHSPVLD
jgi:hypothetical protein